MPSTIPLPLNSIPTPIRQHLPLTQPQDRSSSPEAKVYYFPESALYLKSAPGGTLQNEAAMDSYFHQKGLGPEVVSYVPGETDWLLTRAVPGESCIHQSLLADPRRLCDILAQSLRMLHSLDYAHCPITNRTETYRRSVRENYRVGCCDLRLLPDHWRISSREEAWQIAECGLPYFRQDTLIHGDYCLPNILLRDWQLTGFIDLGFGGVGDRHIDLFWGLWSLEFNLKTNAYTRRFLDVYGRDWVEPEKLRVVAAAEVFG